MDEKLLRMLISEMVADAIDELDEEEELDEFSGAGAIAGYTLPLGMEPKVKKTRRLGESAAHGAGVMPSESSAIGGFNDHLPDENDSDKERQRKKIEHALKTYESSVEKLANSFGGADSPFGKKSRSSRKKIIGFLSPKI